MTRKSAIATIGFVVGMLASGGSVLPDLFGRLAWAWNGGRGESAIWGEPFFYFLFMGLPGGLLGLFVAQLVAAAWCGYSSDRARHVSDRHG